MDEQGCQVEIEHGLLVIFTKAKEFLAKVKRSRNRLYTISLKTTKPTCLLGKLSEDSWLWHARYGHLNFEALRNLSTKQMVKGILHVERIKQVCDSCVITKQRRTPFPQQANFRAVSVLQLVHGDLCGPITPTTHGGNKFFLLLVDDLSRYMWIELLKNKSDAFLGFKRVKNKIETESGKKLQALRTDRGGEFTSIEFKEYCESSGIKRYLTAPYSPQQNGVVERRNQTVIAMVRSMLKCKNLPMHFWAKAVKTAV